jgi:hypothetical protein
MRLSTKIARSGRVAGWLIAGLAAGLILAPAAAVAATVMILHGANGPEVNASSANQLLTAEAPPSTWVSEYGFSDVAGGCANLPVVSTTRGFIVKQINADVLGVSSGDTAVYVSKGPGCVSKNIIAEVDANGNNVVYPFNPGIALPAKGQVSIRYNGPALQIRVQVLGYTVPGSDAPGTRRSWTARSRRPRANSAVTAGAG